MNVDGILTLQTVTGTGLRFEARFASGFTTVIDSGHEAVAPSPVENLLGALAACEAMDVLSILRKKRQDITAYEVVMSGERAETHPRRYTAIHLVHRLTGHGVSEAAVAEAVKLSREKYCSVHHTLDPNMPVTDRIEILEA